MNKNLSIFIAMLLLVVSFISVFHDHDAQEALSDQPACSVCLLLEDAGEGDLPVPAPWVILLGLIVHLVVFKPSFKPLQPYFSSYHTRAPPVFPV